MRSVSAIDIKTITKILDTMIQFELSLSAFYAQCAETWDVDVTFWGILANAETHHAANIQKMLDIITQKLERFEAGRPFNLVALNTALAGIAENTRRVSKGEFSRERIHIMARDIEQSILESRYAEIVNTTDVEYLNLMKDILSETYEHKKIIQEKIDAMRPKS
jgi:rubrerythrin